MKFKALSYCIQRALTRPRALWRVSRAFGFGVALKLLAMRLGDRHRVHRIRIPQWPDPVFLRGGSSSDSLVLFEVAGTDEYGQVGDLDSPHLIIDCGANIGLASRYFLNRYPSARIVAVEPGPETVDLCRTNLRGFEDRVQVVQGAVWSSDGTLVFEPTDRELTAKVRMAVAGEDASTSAYSMSALIALGGGGGIDLLKIDIEGGEQELFGSHVQTWLPLVNNLVIELHGPECEKVFYLAMAPYDYEMSRCDTVVVCRNIRRKPFYRSPDSGSGAA